MVVYYIVDIYARWVGSRTSLKLWGKNNFVTLVFQYAGMLGAVTISRTSNISLNITPLQLYNRRRG